MWKPSIRRGTIGRSPVGVPTGGVTPQPFGQPEDDGPAKFYVNPHGFTGLNGFDLDKPAYAKRWHYRQPLAATAGIMARKGPFNGRR